MSDTLKKISIAIDGYAAAGKWETAKWIAKLFHYKRIDTGAMYRATSLYLIRNTISIDDEKRILESFDDIKIDFVYNDQTEKFDVLLNEENVEWEIRDVAVNKIVGKVAHNLDIRKFLIAQQQKMWAEWGVVMDGRDIWEVVLPNAELKILMTADPLVRAKRRYAEFLAKWKDISLEEVLADIKERDALDDKNMSSCEWQIVLDTTDLSIEEQIQKVVDLIKNIDT